ncbi:MAG: hypothetical protein OQK73_01045 [Gammaproteobacteria bacterium]|nr:hypothetical protein [Gammaproteobacteria bacterium]
MDINELDKTFAQSSPESIQEQHDRYQQLLSELPANATSLDEAKIMLDLAETEVVLEKKEEAWGHARKAFDKFIAEDQWQDAVEACNVLYQTDQPASISALCQGVWLAVSFPVLPDTSIAMLNNVVEETPNDSDGAAVAAITACYLADLRSSDEKHDSLSFLAKNILGQVAQRHSQVNNQAQLEIWMDKLSLRDPQEFLPRLSTVINVMVGEDWWFDRDKLREKMPQ